MSSDLLDPSKSLMIGDFTADLFSPNMGGFETLPADLNPMIDLIACDYGVDASCLRFLWDAGYRPISRSLHIIARLDRKDWRVVKNPQLAYDKNHGTETAQSYYVRTMSNDRLAVSGDMYHALSTLPRWDDFRVCPDLFAAYGPPWEETPKLVAEVTHDMTPDRVRLQLAIEDRSMGGKRSVRSMVVTELRRIDETMYNIENLK
jgi:hypothetical protein